MRSQYFGREILQKNIITDNQQSPKRCADEIRKEHDKLKAQKVKITSENVASSRSDIR